MTSQQYQQAKALGRQCAQSGGKEADNPYSRRPSMHRHAQAWTTGFQEGKAERRRAGR